MKVQVELHWSAGDPAIEVVGGSHDMRARIDPRLSHAQVRNACTLLGDQGEAVLSAWESRVGLLTPSQAS